MPPASPVALLAVDRQVPDVSPLFLHVLGCVDEHSAGAGCGVADAHALARLQQLDDEAHHRPGRVELAALLPGVVGELVDQVLVGVAQHVAAAGCVLLEVVVAQVQVAEVGEQAADDALPVCRAAQFGLVVPVRARQHAVQSGSIGVLNGVTCDIKRLPQVHRGPDDGGPASGLRHEELVLVPVPERQLARDALRHGVLDLLVKAVGEPLEEEDGEDVVLVVGRVDLPAQDVRGLPQLRLELLSSKRHPPLPLACIYCPARDLAYHRVAERLAPQPGGLHRRTVRRFRSLYEPGHDVELARGGHGHLDIAQTPSGERRDGGAHRQPLG